MRKVCPDAATPDHPGWNECVENLSYAQIRDICGTLGEQTPSVVDALFSSRPSPILQRKVDGETLAWHGCFWNSVSGGSIGGYRWIGVGLGSEWVLTDMPQTYVRGVDDGRPESLTVFDGWARGNGSDGPLVHGQVLYAYRLSERKAGSWIATRSETNQDDINAAIRQMGMVPPYCGTIHPGETEADHGDCSVLPSLHIVAVSPTLLVVRSVKSRKHPYTVHGIFWRSVTGYNILNDIGAGRVAAPTP